MYAVIKTGGKQYRVQPGDVLVVEKLEGEPGAEIRFDQVLMVGDEGGATVGAPLVDGAVVTGALIETRKGEKVRIFKKTRRQGYRRTRGHRQTESVIRVTALTGAGKDAKWDGTVDLTPRSVLVARARGLAGSLAATEETVPAGVTAEAVVVDDVKDATVHAAVVEHADPAPEAAPKKTKAKKAEAEAPAAEAAAPAGEAAPKKAKAKKKTDDAAPEGGEA
ncbi:MAG TPA: 50S ribosomal protein L21 [Caulobacteraceae bacterium]|nr:50S ribosomal protein L21 [Caulobacteraceae bacterium]